MSIPVLAAKQEEAHPITPGGLHCFKRVPHD